MFGTVEKDDEDSVHRQIRALKNRQKFHRAYRISRKQLICRISEFDDQKQIFIQVSRKRAQIFQRNFDEFLKEAPKILFINLKLSNH